MRLMRTVGAETLLRGGPQRGKLNSTAMGSLRSFSDSELGQEF